MQVLCFSLLQFNADAQIAWSLKQCVDTALKNNPTIQQYQNTVSLNVVSLTQSKNNLLPDLNGNAGESFNSGRTINPVSNQFSTGNIFSSNFSLGSSVVLFNGFQNQNMIKQNKLNVQSAKFDLEAIKNDISLNIVNAYLQVLFSKELVKVAVSQQTATQQQLNKTEVLVSVGKKTESDLLQVKSQLASDRLSLTNANGQLKTNLLTIQQLMNITVSYDFDIETPLVPEPGLQELSNANETYRLALKIQPVIQSTILKTQSALYAVKISKGGYYPKLSLVGNLASNYSGNSKLSTLNYINSIQPIGYLQSNSGEIVVGNISTPAYTNRNYPFHKQLKDNFSKTISLSLTIPIFNNFTVKNNIQRQRINLNNARLNETIAQNDLRKNIEQAYIDAENSRGKYNAGNEQLAAVYASFQNSNVKYDNGLMTASDFLVEKNKYIKAQSDNIQAKFELIFRLKIIEYYKGTLLNF